MKSSDTLAELAKALSSAQGEFENIKKENSANVQGRDGKQGFKYTYADLASAWDSIRPTLSKNGLSVIQLPSGGPDIVTVDTRLLHVSGEWLEQSFSLKPDKLGCQGGGGAVTFLRRYALMACLGLAAEDDDANEASGNQAVTQKKEYSKPQPVPDPEISPEAQAKFTEIAGMITSGVVTPQEVLGFGYGTATDAKNKNDVKTLNLILGKLTILKQERTANAGNQ